MAETLPMRLAEVFTSPMGTTVLTLAMLGIVGTVVWAFWEKQRPKKTTSSTVETLRPVAPPLLSPGINRPAVQVGSISGGDGVLKNIIIGIVALVVVIIGSMVIAGGKPTEAGEKLAAATEKPTETAERPVEFQTPDPVIIACEEGPVQYGAKPDGNSLGKAPVLSYKICRSRAAAVFDLVGIAPLKDGTDTDQAATAVQPAPVPLTDLVWKPQELPRLLSPTYEESTGFALSRDKFEMVAGPAHSLDDYELFVAVGMAGFDVTSGVADQRAANRSFHIGRYVLDELRAEERASDCKSPAMVYAVSVGGYQGSGKIVAAEDAASAPQTAAGGNMGGIFRQSAPLLFGVKYEQRVYPTVSGDGEMTEEEKEAERLKRIDQDHLDLIGDFLASYGVTAMTDFDLRDFSEPQVLFVENACTNRTIQ